MTQQTQQSTTMDTQMLSQLMKTTPIPSVLLQRIPNLPPNVNTWTQIFGLMTSGQLNQSYAPIIRQAYSVHLQMLQKQHAQKIQ
ncbi:uncharacterized protein CYBJADRAFT_125699, partial [Cyberlindnera jadinii NRRL Y-1542]